MLVHLSFFHNFYNECLVLFCLVRTCLVACSFMFCANVVFGWSKWLLCCKAVASFWECSWSDLILYDHSRRWEYLVLQSSCWASGHRTWWLASNTFFRSHSMRRFKIGLRIVFKMFWNTFVQFHVAYNIDLSIHDI